MILFPKGEFLKELYRGVPLVEWLSLPRLRVFFFPREPQKSAREHFGKSAREPFEFAREHFWKTCPWTWKSARERELSARESSKCPWTIFWKVPVNLKSVREQFLEKFIYWQIFLIWVSHHPWKIFCAREKFKSIVFLKLICMSQTPCSHAPFPEINSISWKYRSFYPYIL